MSSVQIGGAADAMQAEAFRVWFDRERSELVVQLAMLVKQSTESLTSGNQQRVTELRRTIRRTEADIAQIDRMVEALEQRFPAEIRRRA